MATPPPIVDSPGSSAMMNFDPNTLISNCVVRASGADDNMTTSVGGIGDIGSSAADLDALFNTAAYFNIPGGEVSGGMAGISTGSMQNVGNQNANVGPSNSFLPTLVGLGEASAPYDRFETLSPNAELGNGNAMLGNYQDSHSGFSLSGDTDHPMGNGLGPSDAGARHISFDYGLNGHGFGGESLATEGMDNVSDGLKQGTGGSNL